MLKRFYKPFFVAILILYASLTSSKNLDGINFIPWENFDKVVHFGMYFTLFVVLYKSIFIRDKKTVTKFLTLILVILYGLTMEILQKYISVDRSFEVYDLIANSVGTIFGYLIFSILIKSRWIYKLL